MDEVVIDAKTYGEGGWAINCLVLTPLAVRRGPEHVDLPEEATDEDLKSAVLAKYH
jgi:hypothetical protein